MFNTKITVARRLSFGFGTLLVLMAMVAGIGISRLSEVDKVTSALTDKDRLVAYANTNMESLVRSDGLLCIGSHAMGRDIRAKTRDSSNGCELASSRSPNGHVIKAVDY